MLTWARTQLKLGPRHGYIELHVLVVNFFSKCLYKIWFKHILLTKTFKIYLKDVTNDLAPEVIKLFSCSTQLGVKLFCS